MVEYRQRLRVMLSATQGKYELEKSSIGKDINYIYYFTYFYPYSSHPYWDEFKDEFKDEIEKRVEKLGNSINKLYDKFFDLYNTLDDLDSKLELLLYRINRITKMVETSIVKLKAHIKEQVRENKECIDESVRFIECIIKFILSCLRVYICEQTNCIREHLEDLKTVFTVLQGLAYIKYFNCKLKNNINKLDLSKKVQELLSETNVEDIKRIINKICPGYFVYLHLVRFYVKILLCLTEKRYLSSKSGSEAYLTLARIVLYSVDFEMTNLLRLGYNILHLYYPILGIIRLKEFQKEIKVLEEHEKKLEPLRETLKGYTAALETIRCRIDKLYDLEEDVAKLPDLPKLEDLSKLQDMPKNLQTLNELYTSIQQLNLGIQGLGQEKFLEALKKDLGIGSVGAGNLSNVGLEEIVKKLSEVTDSYCKQITQKFKEKVKGILGECSTTLKSIEVPKTEVQQTICRNITTCIVHARILIVISIGTGCKQLEDIDLSQLRKNLRNLETGIPYIKKLCLDFKVCGAIKQGVEKINFSCKTGDEILAEFGKSIEALESKLNEIKKKKDEITNAKEKIDGTLKEAKALIAKRTLLSFVNFKVQCLEHNLTNVTLQLVPFVDKVNGVICTLEKEIQHLRQQLKTTREELDIINGFKSSVEQEIEKMKQNIAKIKEACNTIPVQYKEYTSALTALKEALKALETCLDYLVVRFLKCSLATTPASPGGC